jgi:hypothetical protein
MPQLNYVMGSQPNNARPVTAEQAPPLRSEPLVPTELLQAAPGPAPNGPPQAAAGDATAEQNQSQPATTVKVSDAQPEPAATPAGTPQAAANDTPAPQDKLKETSAPQPLQVQPAAPSAPKDPSEAVNEDASAALIGFPMPAGGVQTSDGAKRPNKLRDSSPHLAPTAGNVETDQRSADAQ